MWGAGQVRAPESAGQRPWKGAMKEWEASIEEDASGKVTITGRWPFSHSEGHQSGTSFAYREEDFTAVRLSHV
jgi:hypothetical protein